MEKPKVAVIGAGLVGSLAGLYMAQLGYSVEVYERRSDQRGDMSSENRSINLALSNRGISALKKVSLDARVLESSLPMNARMVHSVDQTTWPLPYGLPGEAIFSINRKDFNELLLNSLTAADILLSFNMQLVGIDEKKMEISFYDTKSQKILKKKVDFILGCDGAYSMVRKELSRITKLDFLQEYAQHGYIEIRVPSDEQCKWKLAKEYLHIWPRNDFMLIALPNSDGTFTATLFYPYELLSSLKESGNGISFFEQNFPDFLEVAGREPILNAFQNNPIGSMITIKCSRYHYQDKILLLGDAAHAMVPFYGQGMNAGFEDLEVLNNLFVEKDTLSDVFSSYSRERVPNAHAICDLALYNYWEMSSGVQSLKFLLKHHIYKWIHKMFPNQFLPLYSMVAFSNIPYSQVIRRHRLQEYGLFMLTAAGMGIVTGAILAAAYAIKRKLL